MKTKLAIVALAILAIVASQLPFVGPDARVILLPLGSLLIGWVMPAPGGGAAKIGPVALVLLLGACTPADRAGVPVLSTVDAIGRGVSKVLGWCDAAGADETTLARAVEAYEKRNYQDAVALAADMVRNLREAGADVPEDTELMLRLVEGAMAAQAIQDGMRALSGGPS